MDLHPLHWIDNPVITSSTGHPYIMPICNIHEVLNEIHIVSISVVLRDPYLTAPLRVHFISTACDTLGSLFQYRGIFSH